MMKRTLSTAVTIAALFGISAAQATPAPRSHEVQSRAATGADVHKAGYYGHSRWRSHHRWGSHRSHYREHYRDRDSDYGDRDRGGYRDRHRDYDRDSYHDRDKY